jgi:alcohol dehydrogenase
MSANSVAGTSLDSAVGATAAGLVTARRSRPRIRPKSSSMGLFAGGGAVSGGLARLLGDALITGDRSVIASTPGVLRFVRVGIGAALNLSLRRRCLPERVLDACGRLHRLRERDFGPISHVVFGASVLPRDLLRKRANTRTSREEAVAPTGVARPNRTRGGRAGQAGLRFRDAVARPAEHSYAGVSKYLVPEILFGDGALDEVGHAAVRAGAQRPLLVTDPGVWEAGWSASALRLLSDAGLQPTVWAGITPNPRAFEIQLGAELYREHECDVLVAVGGGSCIDAAKGVAVVVSNGGCILDYEGIDTVTQPLPPLVAAPTTAGTGADLSQFAIISDVARGVKVTLLGRALVPDISITDPRALATMPDWLAATTGLDALTHGIESFVSRGANFLTDGHALCAVSLVRQHLPHVVDDSRNAAAQSGMARASMSAGIAFTNAILGATQAISHQLGGTQDLPHGMLNALLLPHVVRFNGSECPDKFRPIADALGVDAARMPVGEVAESIAAAVSELAAYFGMPQRLRDLQVRAQDLPSYAETALLDACMVTNPRKMTKADVLSLLQAAY